jgi:hypothetical protein
VPPTDVEFSFAVTVTSFWVATPNDIALKVPEVRPAAIVMEAGTITVASELVSLTITPPFTAGPVKVTVPTEELPPVIELGLKVSELTPAG